MSPRPALAALGLLAATSLALAGCAPAGSDDAAASDGIDAASATSVEDFGSFEALEEAAKAEGALNVIALPRDWANYGEILDLFAERYPEIAIEEQSPDVSSAEEIQAAEANAGLDTAPDVFDLGLTVALQNTDAFAPYRVQTWDDIPDELKHPEGLFVGDYGGYMSIGYDASSFDAPTSLDDLLGSEFAGSVAINGDPTQAGAAFAAVGLATVQSGGTLDDFQPGIDFFSELNAAGNLLKVDVTSATVASGETPVVFDWDYLNAAHSAENPDWKTVVLDGVGYAGYYNQAINADAPHPAAARLWQEFLYSDEVQNLWLKGGARPVRAEAMAAAGTIDEELYAALPEAPEETVVPTEEQSEAAGTLLGETWAAAVE
ncbi:ABC transporter substrate-binding protein [Microbacterium barkeri]|uniref:ABC transporter substrate-binding protein n=1 Tax=Microbacterium barkeri TaxID=33917 RepID=A0A9W6H1J7_9MICO|nr:MULTISPECIES: ABC transporter substrate-binding protein [Microbacterium]MDR6875260.1 putative spermidine/putrescine transport system substrate-binding protein [Microbacterium barkeri]WRH18119.1 extracellular solute-binding protein [Microbacterium sp. JZ37]GLJ60577.1 ABC transporter substrate-binding protein [Microbacterium barkeri]